MIVGSDLETKASRGSTAGFESEDRDPNLALETFTRMAVSKSSSPSEPQSPPKE
jgi:hypothetical protein